MFWKIIISVALFVMLTSGPALAVQYPPQPTTTTTRIGSTTTTQKVAATTTVKKVITSPPKKVVQAKRGNLARTGADNIAMAVRIGVVLMVAGFVLYLAGRYRRTTRT